MIKTHKPEYSDYEFIHEGRLKLSNVLHAAKKPYNSLGKLTYERRLQLINNQANSRSACR